MRSSLGEKLRTARQNSHLSISEAAEKLGISQPYLSNLENDKRTNPSMEILYAMADLYKVSLDFFTRDFDNDRLSSKPSVNEDKERKITKIVELLRKIDDSKFEKTFSIIKNILDEFID